MKEQNEKQAIEEMAKVITKTKNDVNVWERQKNDEDIAEALYNEGYRKQSVGEWVEIKRFYQSGKTLIHYQCSLCGVYLAKQANFCPNCGAKMKGGAEL